MWVEGGVSGGEVVEVVSGVVDVGLQMVRVSASQ